MNGQRRRRHRLPEERSFVTGGKSPSKTEMILWARGRSPVNVRVSAGAGAYEISDQLLLLCERPPWRARRSAGEMSKSDSRHLYRALPVPNAHAGFEAPPTISVFAMTICAADGAKGRSASKHSASATVDRTNRPCLVRDIETNIEFRHFSPPMSLVARWRPPPNQPAESCRRAEHLVMFAPVIALSDRRPHADPVSVAPPRSELGLSIAGPG